MWEKHHQPDVYRNAECVTAVLMYLYILVYVLSHQCNGGRFSHPSGRYRYYCSYCCCVSCNTVVPNNQRLNGWGKVKKVDRNKLLLHTMLLLHITIAVNRCFYVSRLLLHTGTEYVFLHTYVVQIVGTRIYPAGYIHSLLAHGRAIRRYEPATYQRRTYQF